jgi:hypothetical protein
MWNVVALSVFMLVGFNKHTDIQHNATQHKDNQHKDNQQKDTTNIKFFMGLSHEAKPQKSKIKCRDKERLNGRDSGQELLKISEKNRLAIILAWQHVISSKGISSTVILCMRVESGSLKFAVVNEKERHWGRDKERQKKRDGVRQRKE